MFLGESRHQLDAKNRIRIPAKFRTELGDRYIISVGSNGCLCVYSTDKFEKYVQKFENIPSCDLVAQNTMRKIFALATEAEPDEQGRFILPKNLINFAKIDRNIVINGFGTKIEIWSEEVWDKNNNCENIDEELAYIGEKYGV